MYARFLILVTSLLISIFVCLRKTVPLHEIVIAVIAMIGSMALVALNTSKYFRHVRHWEAFDGFVPL